MVTNLSRVGHQLKGRGPGDHLQNTAWGLHTIEDEVLMY